MCSTKTANLSARLGTAVLTVVVLAFALVSPSAAKTTKSIASGDWGNSTIWNNGVPVNGDDVIIGQNTTVTYKVAQAVTLNSLTIEVNGTLTAPGSAKDLYVNNTFENRGYFRRAKAGSTTTAGNLINYGVIEDMVSATLRVSGKLTNSGTISFSSGSLEITGVGGLENTGTIALSTASLTLTNSGTFTNSGNLTSSSGNMTFPGAVINATGKTFGTESGTVTAAGNFTNLGTVSFGSASLLRITGAGNSEISSGTSLALGRLEIQKSSASDIVTLYSDLTLNYESGAALILTRGILNTNGRNLTANTGTAEIQGTSSGTLNINGGNVNIYKLNQSSTYPFRTNLTGSPTVTIYLHEIGGAGRFEINSGSLSYTGPSSALTLASATGDGGWYATGGIVSFLGSITGSATGGSIFQASGNAVIVFIGNTPSTVQLHGSLTPVTATWAFNDLRIQKTGGATVSFTTATGTLGSSVTATSGVTVNSGGGLTLAGNFASGHGFVLSQVSNQGTLTQSADIYVSGDWTGTGNYSYTSTPSLIFNGPGNNSFACNGNTFYRLLIDKSTGSISLNGNLVVANNLTVNSGTLLVGSGTVQLGTASASGSVNVNGGVFSIVGTALARGTVTAVSQNFPYTFTVGGGTIAAQNANFQYMGTGGISITSGGTIHSTHNFSNCSFDHGDISGPCLKIENSQLLDDMLNVDFSGPAGSYNIEKLGNTGHITINYGSGTIWGEEYDNDPYNRIDWVTAVRHDVGVSAVLVPADTIGENTQVYPRVTVHNYGGAEESFNVRVRITTTGGTPVFNQTEPVTNLGIGEIRTVTFSTYWTATPLGNYRLTAYTELGGDQGPGNDTASKDFTVVVEKPGTVTLVRPAANAQNQSVADTLIWRRAERATEYIVFLDLLNPPQETLAQNLTDTFCVYSGLIDGRDYYWRVVAKNAGGETPSSVRMFTTMQAPGQPVLVSPLPSTPNQPVSGQLSWQAAARAYNGYDVYLDVVNPPQTRVSSGQTAVTYDYAGLEHGRQYFWQVIAKNAGGQTASGVWNFYTVQAKPGPFDLSTPPNGATEVPLAGNLTWKKSERANVYDIYLSTNPSPVTKIASDIPDTIYPYTGYVTAGRKYYWRVVAKNNNPSGTLCNATFNFTTQETGNATDVGVISIVSPVGTVDTHEVVEPRSMVGNFGPTAATFKAYFHLYDHTDALVYSESTTISNLPPAGSTLAAFPAWPKPHAPGTYTTRCSTAIEGDIYPANNVLSSSFTVRIPVERDVEVTSILAPVGSFDTSAVIRPKAKVKNLGTLPATFRTYFSFSSGTDEPTYSESLDVQLEPGYATTLTFPVWPKPHAVGYYVTRCSTAMAGDEYPDNDLRTGTFSITDQPVVYDVGVSQIIAPTGHIPYGVFVRPTVKIENYGDDAVTCDLRFLILTASGTPVYDTTEADIPIDPSIPVIRQLEKRWLSDAGNYTVKAYTILATDQHPENDTARGTVTVAQHAGWTALRPMPSGGGKAVKDGGWLAWDRTARKLYAAKGNKTAEFFRYDPEGDSWTQLADIKPMEGTKSALPFKGSTGAADGRGHVYMVKGANTLGFWRYHIEGDSWHRLPDVPTFGAPKKVKGGSDLVYVERGDSSFLYLLKGMKTEFYRYNVTLGKWDTLRDAPSAPGRMKYDNGSFLVYDGNNTIYAHQAKFNDGQNHFMYKYNLETGQWQSTPLKGMPLVGLNKGAMRAKKSKEGAGGDWYDGAIYALKGGGTQQFFCYVPGIRDTWYELDTLPQVGSGSSRPKLVKNGGSFVATGDGVFYALKGNKTLELWGYFPSFTPSIAPTYPAPTHNLQTARITASALPFDIIPNPLVSDFATVRFSLPTPGTTSLTVFDVAGRSVLRQSVLCGKHTTTILDLRKLSPGVYLIRLESGNYSTSRKLVVR